MAPLSTDRSVIQVNDLVKTYPPNIVAVDHATFSVNRGEIFGFLGLNGAGKTTTIKILATLIRPSSGDVKVFGFDACKDGMEIRRRTGVVQQKESYDRNLTVGASLRIYASLWGIKRYDTTRRIDFLLKKFGLEDLKDRKIRWLSFGQRRRLQVAREFLHDCSLLILDEPTTGLDVLSRQSFLAFCKERAKVDGQTIFFTTHVVSEAEYLCDRLAVIHKGKIVAIDTPKKLKEKYGGMRSVSVTLRDGTVVPKVQKLADSIAGVQRTEVVREAQEVRVVSDDPFRLATELSQALEANGLEPESLSIREPSLEDVIVRLFGGAS